MRASLATVIIFSWVLLCPVGSAHAASSDARVEALMDNARNLLQKGDVSAALQEFEKVISVDGTNSEALYRAAIIYLRLNQIPKGIAYLERSVASAPDNVRLRMILAQAYENAEMYDKALTEYRKVQMMKSTPAEAKEAHKRERIILGKQQGKKGNFKQALEEFDSVLKEYPDDVPTLLDEGLTLMFMNRLDDARATMAKALALQPRNGLIHRYLGEIAEKQGKFEQSAQEYQRALDLAPKGSPVIPPMKVKLALVRGLQFVSEGKMADAQREYEKVLAIEPRNPVARFNLARIYHDLGNLPRAEEMLNSLLEDNPADLGIELRLGTLFLEQGNLEQAAQKFNDVITKGGDAPEVKQAAELLSGMRSAAEKSPARALPNDDRINLYRSIVKSNPDDRKAWFDLGLLYIKLERRDEAVQAFENVVRLGANDPGAQAILGGLYDDMGKFDKALPPLNRALELENDPQKKKKLAEQIAMALAKRAFNAGEVDVSEKEFSQIVELDPDNYIAHFFLALIYTRKDQIDLAEKEYKEVLRIVPGHALARLNLGAIHEQNGHEEEAVTDYTAVSISHVPGLSDNAKDRLELLMKKISGLSINVGYSLNFDSNSNLSPTAPAQELISNTAGSLSYQRKVRGRRLFWGVRVSPTYSVYHQEQFDFLSTEVSPFINGVWRDLIWSANYSFSETDGVLISQHYNSSNAVSADVMKRFKMVSLLPPLLNDPDGVGSAWRINGSYRTFSSPSSPIYDANTYALGAMLTQAGGAGWSWSGIYNFTANDNVSTLGNDFAYTSHGINLQLSKSVSPNLSLNGGYSFTYSQFTHPDSVTRFTEFRDNKSQSLALGGNYMLNNTLRLYGSFFYQRNDSNLPTGFILSTQDVGTAIGIQSPALGTYHKYGITMGLALNF